MLFVFDFCVEGRRLNIDTGQKLKWFWIDESDTGSCRFHCDLKNRFQRHLRPNHLTPYQRRMTHIQRQTNNRTKQQTTLLYSTDEFPWQNGTKRNNDQDRNPYTYIYSAFKITVSNERINNLFRESHQNDVNEKENGMKGRKSNPKTEIYTIIVHIFIFNVYFMCMMLTFHHLSHHTHTSVN